MASGKRLVFVGDCQALALAQIYQEFVAPLNDETVVWVDAWHPRSTDNAAIGEADVVAEQVFNVMPSVTASGMRQNAAKVKFPAIFIGFLWPYSGQAAHLRNPSVPLLEHGPYPAQLGDTFLNKLIADGVEPEEALQRYLELDIARAAHLDRLAELHIAAQASRDDKTGFAFARVIEERFRDTHLFLTSSHPTLHLVTLLIRGVFERLGVASPLIDSVVQRQRLPPFPNHALPIHPRIIEHFGLRFANAETRYPFNDEGSFTFAEFVIRYMNCTWNEKLIESIALVHGEDLPKAHAMLESALVFSPDSAAGWRSMSLLLRRMNRVPEAYAAAGRAVALDPTDPANRLELARVFQDGGNIVRALTETKQAVAVFPADDEAHRGQAEILFRAGLLNDAAEAARTAITLRPGSPHAHALLGHILARDGDITGAGDSFRKAVALDPGFLDPRTALADVFFQQNRDDEALVIIHGIVANGLGNAHVFSLLRRILTRNRGGVQDAANRLGLARALRQHGDLIGAEAEARETIVQFPDDADAYFVLTDILLALGRPDEAAAIAVRANALDPANPHIIAMLGHVRARQDDLKGAEAAFRQATALDASVLGFRASLAHVLIRQGREDESLALSQEVAAAGSDDPHLYALLGQLLARQDDFAGAADAYRKVIDLDPAFNSAVHDWLADVQRRQLAALPAAPDPVPAPPSHNDAENAMPDRISALDFVSALYRILLLREPDEAGLASKLEAFRADGRDIEQAIRSYLISDEFQQNFPAFCRAYASASAAPSDVGTIAGRGSAPSAAEVADGLSGNPMSVQPRRGQVRARIIDTLWRGQDPFLNFPVRDYTLDTQGWNSDHPYLVEAMTAIRPQVVVEVGVWKGGSTITMARRLRALGLDGAVIAVDTWLGSAEHWANDDWFSQLHMAHGYPRLAYQATANVLMLGLEDFVVPLPLDSRSAMHVLRHFGIRPEVVHIDGGHDYDMVMADLRAWWGHLKPGGLLIGDDYGPDGAWQDVRRAFDDFFGPLGLTPLEHHADKCRIRKPVQPA